MTFKKKTATAGGGVTDEHIAQLAAAAASAGDTKLVKMCGKALGGSSAARKECARVLIAARAMRAHSRLAKPGE